MSTFPVAAPPEPPPELANEKYLEYFDGQWIKKEGPGRGNHEDVTKAIYNLLRRSPDVKGKIREHWTVLLGAAKAEPDVTLSHPIYNVSDGYLVSPAFLVVEVRSYGQTLPSSKNAKRVITPAGIQFCWIVDAEAEIGYECHAGGPDPRPVDTLTAGAIAVPVFEIFSRSIGALNRLHRPKVRHSLADARGSVSLAHAISALNRDLIHARMPCGR